MGTGSKKLSEAQIENTLRTAAAPPLDLDRIGAAIAARADSEGLVEVAYAELDSPIGTLLAATTDVGLVQIRWHNSDRDQSLEGLAAAFGPRVVEVPRRLEAVRRELGEYFEGRRQSFGLTLDWRLTNGFVRKVLKETAAIPFGETRTYAEMATAAGSPRAFRAAGSALGANPIPIVVPCHRVLRRGGALGGYGGGLDVKRALLELEGIAS